MRKFLLYTGNIFLTLCAACTLFFMAGCSDTVVKEPGQRVYRIDYSKCPGCGFCIKPCPENAISEYELEGELVVIIDSDKCIGCGECVPYCDFDALVKEHQH